MSRTPEQERLFEASGRVEHYDPVATFLYHLMRDEIPPGKVADLIYTSTDPHPSSFTNGWLASYAGWLADRLREPPKVIDVRAPATDRE